MPINTNNIYIEKILKDRKITDFLKERGIHPSRQSKGRLLYHCPIHLGDNDPSFVVYMPNEGKIAVPYETYYCYGCHSGLNILNLKKDIDKISMKEAVKYFLKDMEIDEEDITNDILRRIQEDEQIDNLSEQIELILLMLNSTCRMHLEMCSDYEEQEFFDQFFRKIDKIAIEGNIVLLRRIYDLMVDEKVLEKRVINFNERQEKEKLESVSWRI